MYFWIGLSLRGIQAIGTSAYFTATYAVLVDEWRGSKLSFAIGIYEVFTGDFSTCIFSNLTLFLNKVSV